MSDSVEVAARAFGIIVKHFEHNGAMRLPARTSLEK